MKLSCFRPAVFAFLCRAGFLNADVVTLKDGKKLEGNILSEGPEGIRMRYRLTPKIWDEKNILHAEIAEGGILKQKPEEMELIELKKQLPTPDLMTAEQYEQLIQDSLRPFVNRYPGTKEATEVDQMIVKAQEEKGKVVAGGVQLEGKWLDPDEAKAENYNIKAYGLRAAMMKKAEAKDYSGALKDFEKLTAANASVHYPKAIEEVIAILTKYEAQIEQMIKDQPTLQKTRDENVKKLIEPDLSRTKDAITREQEQWKTTYDLEIRSTRWFTPYKYDLPSLKALSATAVAWKTQLKGIDVTTLGKVNEAIARIMRVEANAAKSADELKKMGDAILEGETAAAGLDATSLKTYRVWFQAYRQRHATAQQQLAMAAAQPQAVAPPGTTGGSSAIAGANAPGMDDRVAAALAAAAGGTAPATSAPITPGAMPTPVTPPPAPVIAAPAPQPPAAAVPMPAPPAEEEGMPMTTLWLMGMGVVIIVLLLAVVMKKK